MKTNQICPWCGEILDEIIEDYNIYKQHYSENEYNDVVQKKRAVDSKTVSACKKCEKTIYNSNLQSWKRIYIPFNIILLIVLMFILTRYDIFYKWKNISHNSSLSALALYSILTLVLLPITIPMSILMNHILFKRNTFRQYYIPITKECENYVLKSLFSSYLIFRHEISQKQRKKEFVKDNILQISANGEKEYIILTKADFETGKCEATFPAMKKENGLALLEKYSEFELSNGEEVLGTLKVEKVFDA